MTTHSTKVTATPYFDDTELHTSQWWRQQQQAIEKGTQFERLFVGWSHPQRIIETLDISFQNLV